MKKLSELTRHEHYFFTVDGSVLKTTHDLFSYLDSCEQSSFEHHVNADKNDFAEWIRSTLLFPELAEAFADSKNISECKKSLLEFFGAFENQPGGIAIEDFFHTVDGYILKTTHELYYYLNNCDDSSFMYHVNGQKNDFANWARGILKYPELADALLKAKDRADAANQVREFVISSPYYRGGVSAYGDYIKKLRKVRIDLKNRSDDPKVKALESFLEYHDDSLPKNEDKQSNFMPAKEEDQKEKSNTLMQAKTIPEKPMTANANNKSNDDSSKKTLEETISFDKIKIPERPDDDVKDDIKPAFNRDSFRQFTDEELEGFIKFSKKDKQDDTDPKVEYLKAALEELRNIIKEFRRVGKDPFVADLMIRALSSKIEFYALSKNVDDYNKIIQKMKEIQNEIIECADIKSVNFADEIMKDLKLSSVTLKKEVAQ